MDDLTTDAAPLGNPPASEAPQQTRSRCPKHQPPLVYNITGSNGVHIGPIFHNVMPRSQRVSPEDMPKKEEIDALLRCSREIEERDKLAVSDHLGGKWKSLARLMGFSAGQIDNLEADNPRSVDRAYELVNTWHDKLAHDATVSSLTKLLSSIKAHPVIKRLKP